jgi:hypothetical protein
MPRATFRFYEELNRYLPEHMSKTDFQVEFTGNASLGDLIERLRVPQMEVDLILVNGKSENFKYILRDEDRVSVYPVFETLNIETITRLRATPLRKLRFIADVDLEDITKAMRARGFDVHFNPILSDKVIIEISRTEDKIILTKNRQLLKSRGVTHGILVRPGSTDEQVKRIIDYLDIGKDVSAH